MARTTIPPELVAVNAIQGTLIADNSVTAVHIATNAISGTLVADNAITSTHIAQNNVTATQIAQNTITVTQMADSAIETAKINADAVTGAKIADNAIDSEHYTDGSIDTAHIADAQVTAAKIGANAVTLAKMASLARGSILVGDSAADVSALAIGSNGTVLKSDGTDASWGTISTGAAADDITTGDAAVTLATSSGNITIDAQGSDTDIIFKGTDGSSDITALTLDMSTKGRATFNEYIVLGEANDARIYFNASSGYSPRLQSSTNNLLIYTNNEARLTIDNDGNVLIGTDTGDAFNTTSPLRIGQTTNAYINIKAGTSHAGGILVGDSDDDFMGGFIYSNSTNALSLYANNAVKFTLGPGEGVAGFGAGSGDFAGSMLISNDGGTGTLNNAYYNTGFGWEVFDDLTTGDSNTVMGNQAGYKLTEATGCTLIGRLAGEKLETGSYNTAIGYNTMGDGVVTGASNTAVGNSVMVAVTSGAGNTALGEACAAGLTTGSNNVAIGRSAMSSDTVTANYNVAIGYQALRRVNSGGENIMIGREAGQRITSGAQNVALGHESFMQCQTHNGNTAVGFQALENTANHSNTALGWKAGETITSGLGNICLGYGAIPYANSSNYSYVIGYNCQGVYTNDDDSQIVIGSSTGSDRIYNEFNSNASWTRVSDERYKEEITANTDCGLAFINDLKPITYKWKAKADVPNTFPDYDKDATTRRTDRKFYGMIAQDVKTALDKHSITDFGGWNEIEHGIQTVSQEMFVHPLIKAVQELTAKLEAAEARIKTLEG